MSTLKDIIRFQPHISCVKLPTLRQCHEAHKQTIARKAITKWLNVKCEVNHSGN